MKTGQYLNKIGLSLEVNKYIKLFLILVRLMTLTFGGSTLDHQKCHGGLTSTPPI